MPPEASAKARQPSARSPTAKSRQPSARSQTAIGLTAKIRTAISQTAKSRPQKARDVETFRAFALISNQMRSRAHQAMLAEVRLRAILRTFRSLRILRTLWPFRTLGATLRSLGHIL